jgi:hypothetical protein
MTTVLRGYGITASIPKGFEGRITHLDPVAPLMARPHASAPPFEAEVTRPFIHIANLPLPKERDTFGGGVVETLGANHLFIALVEYGPECVGTKLFSPLGLPRTVSARSFSRSRLQRLVPGQSGYQSFFTHNGRAFCLYIVAGSYARVGTMVHQANQILRSISISSGRTS